MGEIAKAAGISRGTLQRWVGSKENLLNEILWCLAKPLFEQAVRETPGNGVDHVVGVHRHFMSALLASVTLNQFICNEPNYALRLLTNTDSPVSRRLMRLFAAHLEEQVARGHLLTEVPAEQIARFMLPVNQAILINGHFSGRMAALDRALALVRILLASSHLPEVQTALAQTAPTVETIE
nr:QsdR family transcriptional regulator [Desulfatitalea alkaliphila]